VRLVLVEKRRDRVERLLSELRRVLDDPMPGGEYRGEALHVLVRCGACETMLPQALVDAGAVDGPTRAVLDSFGGGSTQQLLRQFAARPAGEVLVTVDPQHFVRRRLLAAVRHQNTLATLGLEPRVVAQSTDDLVADLDAIDREEQQ